MAPNEWERQKDSKWQRHRGKMGAICGKRDAREIVHLNRKVRNIVEKVWTGRALRLGSHPQSVLTAAERRVGDGLTAGGSFIFLLVSPPPHPSVSSAASGHLSPSKVFVSLLQHTLLFLILFCHMSVYPPIPPFLYFWLTGAPPLSLASGPPHNQQHAWDSLHCCMLSHDTKETLTICIQSFSSVFSLCTSFVILFDSLSLLPFLCYHNEAFSPFTSDFLRWLWRAF